MNPKFGNPKGRFNITSNKPKIILLASLALLLITILSLLVVLQSRNAIATKADSTENEIEATNPDTTVLYTPARSMTAGASLSGAELREMMWPKEEVPAGAITDISDLKNKFARVDLRYGEPIRAEDLADTPDAAIIKIRSGMRAVTIDISAKRGVEGWAMPGSSVDVILTHIDNGQLTSKVVVENAKIVSTGGDSSTAAERFATGRRKVSASSTVTLELNPTDALKIETAQQLGTLSLHLRAEEDHLTGGIGSIKQEDLSETKKQEGPECNKGKMVIADQEYWLDCNGKLIQ